MQTKFILLLLLMPIMASAQRLTITAGAQLTLQGNIQLSLLNTSLTNHGNFTAGNSHVRFLGNVPTSIEGTQPIQFAHLEINKSGDPFSTFVALGRTIGISKRLIFTAGHLNPNGSNIDLGSTGVLEGERDNSRIVGSSGGRLIATATMNAPNGANPGNLGMVITSSKNLGNVTVSRRDQAHSHVPGLGIARTFDIVPQNNTNLNATLRFHYLQAELNGVDENSLVFIKSTNSGLTYMNEGFNSRNTTANYVEKSGINSFARYTLAPAGYALPVRFVSFNARCADQKMIITWKTSQEQNSSYYNVEGSTDGVRWTVVGKVAAAGNSSSEKSYSFTDQDPGLKTYYRIAQYDVDGTAHYTGILRSSCSSGDVFAAWPNPFNDRVFINVSASGSSPAVIRLFDSKGRLVRTQQTMLLQGNNQVTMEAGNLPGGTYTLSVEWNNGQVKKSIQMVRQ